MKFGTPAVWHRCVQVQIKLITIADGKVKSWATPAAFMPIVRLQGGISPVTFSHRSLSRWKDEGEGSPAAAIDIFFAVI